MKRRGMTRFLAGTAAVLALTGGTAAMGQQAAPAGATATGDLAAKFGARESVRSISLSPDGAYVAIVAGLPGRTDVIRVINIANGTVKQIGTGDGTAARAYYCGWASPTRLLCNFSGSSIVDGLRVGFTRAMAFDADGRNARLLGRRSVGDALRISQFDGGVIDWRSGDGRVLMTRDFVPEATTGTLLANTGNGLGVELVDTATGRGSIVESPGPASEFFGDGLGNVRLRGIAQTAAENRLSGTVNYSYRAAGSRDWRPFSSYSMYAKTGLQPLGVDGGANVAYASQTLDGRQALYRVALDGSMKSDLVSSSPEVDVSDVVSIGRHGRIIGATYVTDRRQVDYFDPEYKKLAASLSRALPRTPLIQFVDATADESRLLIYAGSDVDAGTYYLYTKADHHLDVVTPARPELDRLPLAQMQAVTYTAADGTKIPGYLTLPPGGAKTGLPAIVMPHGGPAARDEWGFDWLVQYFAQRGYVVFQPEYRGSAGYGDAFYNGNGYRSWKTAIGDVNDAGRWLISQGMADPKKLAIVGWSYGGYAALQSNVLDPDLFKAVVAVAPVTDLDMLKRESAQFTSSKLSADMIGSGPNVAAGSPARHADAFKAPVLLFHGDQDMNVGVAESRAMDAALRGAGKRSTLVVFPGLEHQLDDSNARTQVLRQSDEFLRASMGL